MSDWGNIESVRVLFGFEPMGICMKRPGTLTLALWDFRQLFVLRLCQFKKISIYFIRPRIFIALTRRFIYTKEPELSFSPADPADVFWVWGGGGF